MLLSTRKLGKNMKNEKLICSCCGDIIEYDDFEVDGQFYCQDCFNEHYDYCEDCGALIYKDNENYLWVDGEERMVCENCAYDYTICNDCNEYHRTSDMFYVENLDYWVCYNCRDYGDYYYCSDCDGLFHIDDLRFNDRRNSYYCNDCYPDEPEELLCYHGIRDFHFYKNENELEPREYYGAEIETEPLGSSDISGVLKAINISNINAGAEEDSSLCWGGAEIVTHPETYEYKLSHKENYRKLFQELENINYGNNGGAGLHFHVSKPNEDIITRIIIILESFKEEIKKLSRRNGRFSWSKFLTDYYSEEPVKYQSSKFIKEEYIEKHSRDERYLALNLCNSNTIEFRFFNGANNFEEFWASFQFIHNLMDIAYSDKELNEIHWKDLLQGEELVAQATKLEVINVDKVAKDTTEIYEKLKLVKEEMKESIKKTLKNFIKYINKQMSNVTLEKYSDISEIKQKTTTFINSLEKDLRFLEDVIYFYNYVEQLSINNIKYQVRNLKIAAERNGKNYSRYFKQIENATLKYESEVVA